MRESKKRLGVLKCYVWAHQMYHKEIGKGYHITDVCSVFAGVTAPFAAMAFSGTAVWLIQSNYPNVVIFLAIGLYAALIKALSTIDAFLKNKQVWLYMHGRMRVGARFTEHILSMDFEKFSSKYGQNKLEAANKCVYWGNEMGIEKYLKSFADLSIYVIGFVVYSFLVSKINYGVLLYMIATAVVLTLLSGHAKKVDEAAEEETDRLFLKKKKLFEETSSKTARNDMIMYQMGGWLGTKLHEITNRILAYYKRFYRLYGGVEVVSAVLSFLRDVSVYILLIGQVQRGQIGVSSLLVYAGAIAGFSAWIEGIIDATQGIGFNRHTVNDMYEFLQYGVEEAAAEAPFDDGIPHEIRLENVSFAYDGKEAAAVSKVSLTIKPGEKIALVGANGAGKTTLIKLIIGLYQPTSGKIYIDGKETSAFTRKSFFRTFSVAFQESTIFACSVAQNVSCEVNPDYSRVEECLKKAQLWEKIVSLPEGMKTIMTRQLDPNGVELSGGETQKLMLARGLYRDAGILILDEPTAALDPIAESNMYQTYNSFGAGKTGVFISHRLSSTRFCERVCFMEDGQIIEIGTHQNLLEQNGQYAKMFQIQSRYYKEEFGTEKGEICYE